MGYAYTESQSFCNQGQCTPLPRCKFKSLLSTQINPVWQLTWTSYPELWQQGTNMKTQKYFEPFKQHQLPPKNSVTLPKSTNVLKQIMMEMIMTKKWNTPIAHMLWCCRIRPIFMAALNLGYEILVKNDEGSLTRPQCHHIRPQKIQKMEN